MTKELVGEPKVYQVLSDLRKKLPSERVEMYYFFGRKIDIIAPTRLRPPNT